MTFHVAPGPLGGAFDRACARLEQIAFADALWSRRPDVWTSDTSTQQTIANRLGWLTAIDVVAPQVPRLRALADSIRGEGCTDIVLLGMGGSSLAPEVLRHVLGVAAGFPRFRVLDSVNPEAVRAAMAHAGTSLFVLASKSGSTIEPNVMAAEAQRCIVAATGAHWGSRFIAITDENTTLHRRALEEHFRDIFINPSDIGGRYSALSFFGMVPAAMMGADLDGILAAARDMDTACRHPSASSNSALALGAAMAAGALSGRDKLTLLLPDGLRSLGLWVEQLVAESTGKEGKGVVPIAGETPKAHLGSDRIAVTVSLAGEEPDASVLERVRAAGVPLVALEMPHANAIGAEFLRWEIATAAAGALMEINPFDEPNVQQAKEATRVLLERYQQDERLAIPEPQASINGARLTLSAAAQEQLSGAPADAFLRVLRQSDYFGLLAFLPPEHPALAAALEEFRARAAIDTGCATMFGYGPRYLHSTGQLHKGGANNGVFLIVTAAAQEDLAIPGQPFSFGVLEMAQAVGDFQSLDGTGRRVLHVHLPRRDAESLRQITAALLEGRTSSP